MRPTDIQVIGTELAIKWDACEDTFVPLELLRRACPCASCAGERDIMGNLYKGPDKPLRAESFQLTRYEFVGGYGFRPEWGDRHNSGIFSYDYIQKVAASQDT